MEKQRRNRKSSETEMDPVAVLIRDDKFRVTLSSKNLQYMSKQEKWKADGKRGMGSRQEKP